LATVVIYNLNKRALSKELTHFSQQLAQAMYQDLTTEMRWQRQHVVTLSNAVAVLAGVNTSTAASLPTTTRLNQALAHALSLDPELKAVAIYDAKGTLLASQYANYADTLPEHRFPLEGPATEQVKVLSLPQDSRGEGQQNGQPQGFLLHTTLAWPTLAKPKPTVSPNVYVSFLREFSYLSHLVQRHQQTVHQQLYLVNELGNVVMGPLAWGNQPRRLKADDYAFFKALPSGVASTLHTNIAQGWWPVPPMAKQPSPTKGQEDAEDTELDTVFVKLPAIGWGLIIESPYHVQQRYIREARNRTFFVMLAVLGLALLLGLLYVWGIIRNFRQLIKGIKAIAKGNYSRQIRLITNPVTPYELVFLAAEFNRMAHKLATGWQALQLANQQLAELDTLKNNLIDTVSHELRTPLTNIKGYTSRLLRYPHLDETTKQRSLKTIKQQTDRLSRLVEDLLVVPELEHQTLRVYTDAVPVVPLLERVVAPFYDRQEPLLLTRWEALPPDTLVECDPDRLEQVLINLLDNAFKYAMRPTLTPLGEAEGLPVLEVAFTVGVEGDTCKLMVTNPAEAIAPDELARLFDKFHRVDDSMTRTSRGSGLGLFITKGLVEAMGGRISLAYDTPMFSVTVWVPLGHRS
jgi:signal transduction histidine kinase